MCTTVRQTTDANDRLMPVPRVRAQYRKQQRGNLWVPVCVSNSCLETIHFPTKPLCTDELDTPKQQRFYESLYGVLNKKLSYRWQTRDAFRGKSRSPNMIPFHMLGIVSYCAIVTLSLSRAVFTTFDFKKCRDLEMGVRGHSRSLRVVSFHRLCMVSYQCSLVTLSLKCTVFEIFDFKNAATLKTGLGVRQGHWKCHHSIERL